MGQNVHFAYSLDWLFLFGLGPYRCVNSKTRLKIGPGDCRGPQKPFTDVKMSHSKSCSSTLGNFSYWITVSPLF
jgi:hypothetical protein